LKSKLLWIIGVLLISVFGLLLAFSLLSRPSFQSVASGCGLETRFNLDIGESHISYKPLRVEGNTFEDVACLMTKLAFSKEEIKAVHNIYLNYISGDADGIPFYSMSGEIRLHVQANSVLDSFTVNFAKP